ncbi:MAG: shikimate dehydrogenase [Rhodobacterales bacterium CG15_BIG_FIL_POST_REV_8_21_14_020_59_13]|nr:MAG: shikimate dehydrogenase [Rhodobacterales bacterium CG15_BIG_FIL_POST_REV_8_21_14_020_59_13]
MITGRTRIAGVIGSPVTHSLSPLLMNSWIEAAGIDAAYMPFPALSMLSADDLRALGMSGLAGLNVTLPFKTLAAECADQKSEAVIETGAANLLLFNEGGIEARNTDIDGIESALGGAGQAFSKCSVLVLGAGGVARAVCAAARQGDASHLLVCNRTRQKADELAYIFNAESLDWANVQDALISADIVINATSLGMDGHSGPDIDWTMCKAGAIVFDTLYTPARRPFTQGAKAAGLTTIDGLSMLIGQARPSFEALFGVPVPDTVDAEALLRKALGQ